MSPIALALRPLDFVSVSICLAANNSTAKDKNTIISFVFCSLEQVGGVAKYQMYRDRQIFADKIGLATR